MSTHTQAIVNLAALQKNLQSIKKISPQKKIIAVLKCNAYGHGAIPVAEYLKDTDAFAVARVEEAVALRQANIQQPLLVLSGMRNAAELQAMQQENLQPVIHHQQQLDLLQKATAIDTVWLKYDTGMHRLGFNDQQIHHAYQQLKQVATIKNIILMSHFAQSEHPEATQTKQQLQRYHQVLKQYQLDGSFSNSGAIEHNLDIAQHWIRPGIMLYGASNDGSQANHNLNAVMTLRARIISIKQLSPGAQIGYGATYTVKKPTTIAVVAIGYGDGYPRHCPNGTPTLCQGQICPLIGRVSMDMITIDISHLENIEIGDWVTLWGDGLPIEKIAEKAQTLPYELLCNVNSRVERHYIK